MATILIILSSALSSLPALQAQSTSEGGTLRLAFGGRVTNFNQFSGYSLSDAEWWILNLEYKYGITMVPDGRLIPELFNSWWSNPDHTSWFFNIRPDAKWSDGTAVTSDDFIFTLKIGIQPINDYAQVGPLIKNIVKVNSTLTQIDLNHPNTIFDVTLGSAFYYIQALPEHVWGKIASITDFTNFGTDVGDGPFYVSNLQAGSTTVELLRNEFYWEGKPQISKVEVTVVTDTSTIPLLLLGGQIDAARVDPTQVAPLLAKPELGFNIEHYLGSELLTYNVSTYPYTEKDFRQALAYAIDRDSLVRLAVSGFGSAGNPGYVPPNKGDWYEPNVPQYAFSPDKAQQLLGNVLVKGNDGLWHMKDGSPFQPKIYAPSETATSILTAQSIERMLRDVGIDAKSTVVTYGTLASLAASNFRTDMLVEDFPGQVLPYVPPYLTIGWNVRPQIAVVPGSSYWNALWPPSDNATFYDTLTKMNTSPDQETAKSYARELQKQIAENLPTQLLFFYDAIWAHRTDTLVGWPAPDQYIDFELNVLNDTTLINLHTPGATMTETTMTTTTAGGNEALIGGVIVVGLIVVLAAFAVWRRSKKVQTS